jgi:signal transduction histidine kinase
LRELANSVGHGFRIVCDVDCESGILIQDHAVATHLYRIAQEAVQIATKHANASNVLIRLFREGEAIHLRVIDNGLETKDEGDHDLSVALNIMRYRASMAGGGLEIQRNPFGGTIVTCYCGQGLV